MRRFYEALRLRSLATLKGFNYLTANTRPKHITSKKGSTGTKMSLKTNLFKVKKLENWQLLHYSVIFEPDVLTKGEKLSAVRDAIENEDVVYHYGGSESLYTISTLLLKPFKKNVAGSDVAVNVSLKLAQKLEFHSPLSMQFINLLIRRILFRSKMLCIGNNFFDPNSSIEMENADLRVLRGIGKSVGKGEQDDVFLSISRKHKFISRSTVFKSIKPLMDSKDFKSIEDRLIGRNIITGYNHRSYKIVSIDFESTPETLVFSEDGLNCVDYYKNKYGLEIEHKQQPLLLCQTNAEMESVHLIPELCYMTGIPSDVTNYAMKEKIKITNVFPTDMNKLLMDFTGMVSGNTDTKEDLARWAIDIEKKLTQVPSRVISPPNISSRGKTIKYCQAGSTTNKWAYELGKEKVHKAEPIQKISVLTPKYMEDDIKKITAKLRDTIVTLGGSVGDIEHILLKSNDIKKLGNELDKCKGGDLILSSIPTTWYNKFKKITCCDFGVPSQNIDRPMIKAMLTNKFAKLFYDKIALQMMTKTSSVPWLIMPQDDVKNAVKDTIVMGLFTYFEPGTRTMVSAMVSTIDGDLAHYKNDVFFQKSPTSSIEIQRRFSEILNFWRENNGGKEPKKVIVYNLGSSHFSVTHQICKEMADLLNGGVKLQYNVVKKSDDMRFMRDVDSKISNVLHGTIVDDVITRSECYDYFLVSSLPIMGTIATPVHFNVIYDDTSMSPDVSQRLAFALSHGYFNATASFSLPAPCQYAFKLGSMCGFNLNEPFHEKLAFKPFYI